VEHLARERVDFDVGARADLHASQVLLDHVGDQPYPIDLDHRQERRVGRDEGAGVEQPLADEAIDRRSDLGGAQGDLELVEPGLGLVELRPREIQLGLRRLVPRVGVVEGLAGEQLPLEEAARSIEVRLGELEIGFALPHGGAGHVERRLGLAHLLGDLARLDAGQKPALGDAVADADGDVFQPPVHLAGHVDRGLALEAADHGDDVGHRLARGRAELHRQRRASGCRATGGGGTGGGRAAAEQPVQPAGEHDGDEGDDDLLHDACGWILILPCRQPRVGLGPTLTGRVRFRCRWSPR
jgi:hypothetical protein